MKILWLKYNGSKLDSKQWDPTIQSLLGLKSKILTTNTKCWHICGSTGSLIHSWVECKMVQPLWKTDWQFLTKLNILLTHDPAIVSLGIDPNGWNIQMKRKKILKIQKTAQETQESQWRDITHVIRVLKLKGGENGKNNIWGYNGQHYPKIKKKKKSNHNSGNSNNPSQDKYKENHT